MTVPTAEPTAAEPRRLSARAIRGVAWTLPTTIVARALGLVGTVLLARYVAPAEYGEVSAAAILTASAGAVTSFGLGIYLVANRAVTRAEVFHATCWYLFTGAVAIAALWTLSAPLGEWFEVPGLRSFLPLLLVSLALDRLSFVPERVLVRNLRFPVLSLARALGEVAYTGVAVGLAMCGVGAMAVVWGNLARSGVRAIALVATVDPREWLEPHRLRLRLLLDILVYGGNVALASLANFAMRRWDNLIVGRYFGPAALGTYNYAYNLADVPAVTIGEQIGDVLFATMPHVERENRAAVAVRAFKLMAVIMLPLAFGLGAVAPTVAEAFFDRRWVGLGTMLALLSVISAARPIAGTIHSYLFACGRLRTLLWLNWSGFLVLVAAMVAVGRAGIGWTCAAVGLSFVVQVWVALWAVRRSDGTPIARFLRPIAGPVAVACAMVVAVITARPALAGWAPVARLALEIGLGATVYVIGAFVAFRGTALELMSLARSARGRP